MLHQKMCEAYYVNFNGTLVIAFFFLTPIFINKQKVIFKSPQILLLKHLRFEKIMTLFMFFIVDLDDSFSSSSISGIRCFLT